MIKKYFGITLISASMIMAGCSSNDDDGPGGNNNPAPMPDPTDPPASTMVDIPTEFATVDADGADLTLNLVETLTNADNFTMLLNAATNAGIADDLDGVTIFAPTDTAFAALDEVPTGDALSDILLGHVVSGALSGDLVASAAADGLTATAENEDTLTFTAEGEQLLINDVVISGTDLLATNGIIHTIDLVLVPEEDPVEPPGGGTDTPPPGGGAELGAALTGLQAAGFTDYVTIFNNTSLGLALDDNQWTVFVPTDDALSDADVALDSSGAFALIADNLITDGAFSADELLEQGTAAGNGGTTLTFGGTAGALTVNGFNATLVEVTGSNSVIYSIDGVIQ